MKCVFASLVVRQRLGKNNESMDYQMDKDERPLRLKAHSWRAIASKPINPIVIPLHFSQIFGKRNTVFRRSA